MKIYRDGVTVRYYLSPVKGYDSWQVVWRQGKRAEKKRFNTENQAKEFAIKKAKDLGKGLSRTVTAEEGAMFDRSQRALYGTGKTVEEACVLCARIIKALHPTPVDEAIRYYQERHGLGMNKTVKEILPGFLKAKERDDLSASWIRLLKHCLEKFQDAFQGPLASVTPPEINRWLSGLNLSTKSRSNYRVALVTLVSYCKQYGYLPKKWDVMEDVATVTVKHGEIEIYTVEEMEKILKSVSARLLPFVCIQAFAGLRHSEVMACDWTNINLDAGHIVVPAKGNTIRRTKTGRRIVPMMPNLKALLEPCRKKSGPIYDLKSSTVQLSKAAKGAGLKHKRNGYRHSFISYRVAQIQDIAQVSLEAGNSVGVIRKHYLQLVTKEQGEKWFRLGL